ncbi:MAG: SDR family NAD(P)-dependent oxidoreductase [Eubacterium sp.]|nr:SDR family NAD(P)-dependent oxidoreductase [Eubacterium sp.]
MNICLEKKVIVITGSSRGLGKELVIHFAKEGANVVINYCKQKECALELYAKVREINSNCLVVQADVTKEKDVQELYKKVIGKYNKIDVLINNAGKCSDNYIPFMDFNQWNDVITTNLNSIYWCCRAFTKKMIACGGGKIINIASLKGQLGSEGQCNYSASKAGVIGLTKSLAKELGYFGISVNAVCPGFVVTDLNRENSDKAEIAEKMSVLKNNRSLEDLLAFLTILSSDSLAGISGQVFNLDSRII